MAGVYISEGYDKIVGITDLSRCPDIDCINYTIEFLKDVMNCDLVICSNSSEEEIQDHTKIEEFLGEDFSISGYSANFERRCIPFKRTWNKKKYIFMDVLLDMHELVKHKNQMWEQLRAIPFKQNREMDDNLGWAPGICNDGQAGDWQLFSKFTFQQIRHWKASGDLI
jgi:hypothetical protein